MCCNAPQRKATPRPPCSPPHVRPVPPMGGGGLHRTMVALKLHQFQYNLKKFFFGTFGASYFLCFLCP